MWDMIQKFNHSVNREFYFFYDLIGFCICFRI
nr:MAG TPA: hypothetical protein [Caudoviricetes sp.]